MNTETLSKIQKWINQNKVQVIEMKDELPESQVSPTSVVESPTPVVQSPVAQSDESTVSEVVRKYRNSVILGNNIEILRQFPDNTFTAIVTDPPYGLEFMGREWDAPWKSDWQAGGGFSKPGIGDRKTEWPSFSSTSLYGGANPTCANCGGRARGANKCSCETPNWKPIGKRRNPENEGLPDDVTSTGMARQMKMFQEWSEAWAKEVLRVLKPGGHLLSFAGTRTYHRMVCGIEDAGFQIRDKIDEYCELDGYMAWVHGQGFPKSLSISKAIDAQERSRWLKVGKAIDNLDRDGILEAWKEYSRTVRSAGLSFQKRETGTGTLTERNDSALGHVLLGVNQESSDAQAVIAELSSYEAPPIAGGTLSFAPSNVGSGTPESSVLVTIAARTSENQEVKQGMGDSSARCVVLDCLDGNTVDNLKGVGVLKTWTGRNKSFVKEDIDVLCAALTDDLKLITLSRSRTFLGFDTIRRMECASAISVTTTGYMAESLLSFTVDILRHEAIDKAADDSEPATDTAKQWEGYGTALKPAHEPIAVFGKDADPLNPDVPFKYEGKASTKERNRGCENLFWLTGDDGKTVEIPKEEYDRLVAENESRKAEEGFKKHRIAQGNIWPTVKPLDLMRYLVKMVKMPGDNLILDPFAGSGTTLVACELEGCGYIGIDMDQVAVKISNARLECAKKEGEGGYG